MRQLTIHNPQRLQKLPVTTSLILLAMQSTYTIPQLKELQQLLEENQRAGFIVLLERTEPKSYTEYHRKLLERL